jgi:hypothetical protein
MIIADMHSTSTDTAQSSDVAKQDTLICHMAEGCETFCHPKKLNPSAEQVSISLISFHQVSDGIKYKILT